MTKMPSLQRKRAKRVNSKLPCGNFASILLRVGVLSLIFVNLEAFGEDIDFCYDRSNEGKL